MPRTIEFDIDDSYIIKNYLQGKGVSHRILCVLKREPDGILKNGEHARTIDTVEKGDTLSITIPDDEQKNTPTPVYIPLDILYEDEDILVINKQPLLAMHESHNHQNDALSNAVAYYLQSKGKPAVFRAVGRLDKGTSGIVVCALNQFAAAKLSGKIYKEYEAVASGYFEGEGTINAPIYRPDPMKTLRCVDARGEQAITHWKCIHTDGKTTHLRIHLETGRTHQIRVHFKSLGAPLVGDSMYEMPDERISHQALHCCYIRFTHPITDKVMEISAPMPKDMKNILPK